MYIKNLISNILYHRFLLVPDLDRVINAVTKDLDITDANNIELLKNDLHLKKNFEDKDFRAFIDRFIELMKNIPSQHPTLAEMLFIYVEDIVKVQLPREIAQFLWFTEKISNDFNLKVTTLQSNKDLQNAVDAALAYTKEEQKKKAIEEIAKILANILEKGRSGAFK